MYLGDSFNLFGKTQDLDLHGQLSNGIRYFDLRPLWDGSDFYLYHGSALIKGPKLFVVLEDIRRFLEEGHRELVVLKFSHYKDIDDAVYKKMTQMIQHYLERWLYRTLPEGKRLADVSLGSYLARTATVLEIVLGIADGGAGRSARVRSIREHHRLRKNEERPVDQVRQLQRQMQGRSESAL